MTKTSQEHDMMNVKSAFLYGTIEEELYVRQPPSFEDLHLPNKVYKVEKALYGLHQAPRAWYETLSTYLLENRFRKGIINKTSFIKKDKGDLLLVQVDVNDIIFGSTKKSLCIEFKGLMHKKFQMSSMRELTFFLGLQVMQRDDEIFISQDKYVADILKNFDFSLVKTTSTLIETNKTLLKDEEAEDVDVHLYRLMIKSLMYLTASMPDIMFIVCACLWYPRDSPFDLEAFSDSDYARANLDRKSTTGVMILELSGCLDWNETAANDEIQVSVVGLTYYWFSKAYALTVNPTIYTSCIEQFWTTLNVKNVNGEAQIQALVDKKKVIITEASIRRDLIFKDEGGVDCLSNEVIFEQLTLMGTWMVELNFLCIQDLFKYFWIIKLKVWTDIMHFFISSHTKKVFANMKREGNDFSGKVTTLFQSMMVQAPEDMGEEDEKIKKEIKERIEVPSQSSEIPNGEGVPTTSNDPLPSEEANTAQAKEIASLKKRVKKLEQKRKSRTLGLKRLRKVGSSMRVKSLTEASLGDQEDASKQERMIDNINQDVEITLVNETQRRMNEEDMFEVNDLDSDEVVVDVLASEKVKHSAKVIEREVNISDPVTIAGEVVTTAGIEVTTAGYYNCCYNSYCCWYKAHRKEIVMQDPSETPSPKPIISSQKQSQAKDKGKGKMVEPERPLKRKYQIMMDAEVAKNLEAQMQAGLEEDERLARIKKEETNIALVAEWDNTQAMMDADCKLAIEAFVHMDTELIKGSEKAAEGKQEDAKRQRIEEENESAELKRCLEIIHEDDDVTIKATPLSSKSPTIVDYKIYKEGEKSFFKIIRADGSMSVCAGTLIMAAFLQKCLGFLSQKGSRVGRGVKAKQVSNGSNLEEGVTPSMVDMTVEMGKLNSLDDTTVLESFPPLCTPVNTAGNALGKKVAYPVVANYVRNTWGKYRFVHSMFSSSIRLFSFQFSFMDGLDAMLENGQWFIQNNPITLKKWHPDENLLKEDVSIVPIWVKLHGVPVTAFSEDGLSSIATKLGTPLMLDSYTFDMCMQSSGRLSYARVMIELRVDVELKDNIVMAMPKITREGHYICNVRVEYEWKPSRCSSCKVFGHIHEECLKNTSAGERKNVKKPSQTSRGVPVGPKIGKLRLLDNDGNPLVPTGNLESDSEVEVVFDETANLRISTSGKDGSDKGYGTNSLLKQWRDSYPNNDDMYENHDLSEHKDLNDDPMAMEVQIPLVDQTKAVKIVDLSYSERFVNTAYGFFLGKRVVYPVIANYVRNTWGKFGLVKSMLNLSIGLFSFQFSSTDGLNSMLENGLWFIRNHSLILFKWNPNVDLLKKDVGNVLVWFKLHGVLVTAFSEDGLSAITTKLGTLSMRDSYTSDMCLQSWGKSSYARVMIELRADVELKDNIMEVCPKNIGLGVTKNLKKPSQTSRGVSLDLKVGFKPHKEYTLIPKKPTASPSGNKKKGVAHTNKVSNSNPFDVLNSVDSDVEFGASRGLQIRKFEDLIIDGQAILVDEAGFGTQSLLEQWRDSYGNGDFDEDPDDDDMYEG
uniref:Copia protein n=1 Tax=Tanacetum cinerariifolium TaxID=118510 RepID=A0A6L2JV83_TANCI|nr:copia protein [Tanacetum cinerariifolium]